MHPAPDPPHGAGPTRRQASHGIAWSVPVVAVALATPAAAASTSLTDVGAFEISIDNLNSVSGYGFVLGGPAPLPAATIVTITITGREDAGVWRSTTIWIPPSTRGRTRVFTLSRDIQPTENWRCFSDWNTVGGPTPEFLLEAVVTLPPGYTGTGAKTSSRLTIE